MADDERRSAKRSRFDQTEAEVRRPSRFDRRSRSPPTKSESVQRSRSPLDARAPMSPSSAGGKTPTDPASAAAAAAARINAQIQAKKAVQHVDVPPIRQTASPTTGTASSPDGKSGSSIGNINGEIYVAEGDFIKDIEVNDLRNRYTLTKGSTQKMIKEETGADVTTRGNYYPDKSMATAANPPLYLHITSTTRAGLEKAVEKINDMMQQELPNLVDERRFRRREPEQFERDELGRRKWPEEKIPVDLEPIPGFNLRAQVVGHGGAYVKHIQQETRCRVQIKGRGSGFTEHGTNRESDEPMYLHVAGPDPNEVKNARELCLSLLENVKEQYQRFKDNPPPRAYNNQQPQYPNTANPYGSYGNSSSPGGQMSNSYASPPGVMSPTGSSAPGTSGGGRGGNDYASQYSQYYGGGGGGSGAAAGANGSNGGGAAAGAPGAGDQDPYAAYGGYQNYVAYYQWYMQQAAQQQQQQPGGGAPGGADYSAPPPPSGGADDGQPPPPPPPSGSPPGDGGGYNAVPPPPGM